MKLNSFLLAVLLSSCARPGTAPSSVRPLAARYRVHITFYSRVAVPASAIAQYSSIWANERDRIVSAMEAFSGLRFVYPQFADTAITAQVEERASSSGYRGTPMILRASYPMDTKRATLIHELGHRLIAGLFPRGEEEHDELFLWLYDTWVSLYGKPFADAQVEIEKRRAGRYVTAWNAALALDSVSRARRWREIRDERLPSRR